MSNAGNNTACSPYGNCTIMTGSITNGTFYVPRYNPHAPVIYWRQRMELATFTVCNSLTLIVIIARLWYRWRTMRRFRGDDKWMMLSGFLLILFWATQIGMNLSGSGLHFRNVPEPWRSLHWHFSTGWSAFWLICSCIKISVCFVFLQILPPHLKGLRYATYVLCFLIAGLGITNALMWMFNCTPVRSNFIFAVNATSCINPDIFRYFWIGLSVPIDVVIMVVPLQILKRARLRNHERHILKLVFSATLMGTITCIVGIYGVYASRIALAEDAYYTEVPFIMMQNIEILMYTLGASFPVLSRYIIKRTNRGENDTHQNFSSWARYVPNFFLSNLSPVHLSGNLSHIPPAHMDESVHKSVHNDHDTDDAYSGIGASGASDRHMIATPSDCSYRDRDRYASIHEDGVESDDGDRRRDSNLPPINDEDIEKGTH